MEAGAQTKDELLMNRNNILLLVIVILVTILICYGYFIFFKLNNEGFQSVEENVKANMESAKHKCAFYPWGPTLESCKNNCNNPNLILHFLYKEYSLRTAPLQFLELDLQVAMK